MKKIFPIIFCFFIASPLYSQSYVKLNGLYALGGIINPSVEFAVSPHSTVQGEFVFSPWKSIKFKGQSHPFQFSILMVEYRYYLKEANTKWYFGGNAGFSIFEMSKPELRNGGIHLQNRYSKGSGYMIGAVVGYEYQFAKNWIIDAYFGWAYMHSAYNGYTLDGEIDMYPHRPIEPKYPDPYNKSAEWYPNKIGVSIGVMLFDPAKKGRIATVN